MKSRKETFPGSSHGGNKQDSVTFKFLQKATSLNYNGKTHFAVPHLEMGKKVTVALPRIWAFAGSAN